MKKVSLLAALALAACAFGAVAGTVQESTELTARPTTEMTAFRHIAPLDATVVVISYRTASQITAEQVAAQASPAVELQRADQYALRQIDRQRPEVTPAWRECPSV